MLAAAPAHQRAHRSALSPAVVGAQDDDLAPVFVDPVEDTVADSTAQSAAAPHRVMDAQATTVALHDQPDHLSDGLALFVPPTEAPNPLRYTPLALTDAVHFDHAKRGTCGR